MSLFDSASLVVTPNGYKAGKLYSIKPTSGAGDLNVVRATSATRVNEQGLIEIPRTNLLLRSEEFDNASWAKIGTATITANTEISPNGTTSADTLTNAIGSNFIRQQISIPSTIQRYTYSIYVKPNASTSFSVTEAGVTSSSASFSLTGTGSVSVNSLGSALVTATITNVGNGWYRCTFSYTTNGVQTILFLNNNSPSVYIWGAQLEIGNVATEYIPTTSVIRTRVAGITQDGGSANNIPRLDYTNASCPSILVEPQRTNLLLRSEEFDNASWLKTNTTVTANTTTSPDGSTNSDKIIATTTNDLHIFESNLISFASGTVYTFSFYAKKAENNFVQFTASSSLLSTRANYNLLNGTLGFVDSGISATITAVGDDWYRCTATFTASTTGSFRIIICAITTSNAVRFQTFAGNGTNGVFLWGAQLEVGANATSYIPTVASTVTRNADVISKTGISSLIGQTEGTLFIDFNFINNYNFGRLLAIGDGDVFNRIFISITTNNAFQVFVRNTAGIQYSALSSANRPTGRYKLALTYKQNDFAFYLNGVLINSSTSGQVPPSLNNLYLSTLEFSATAVELNSINSALIFPTRLSNAELAQLTTL